MKKITLLFFLFFTSHFYSQTPVPVATIEYQALVDFYNATNGSSWNSKWNISSNNLHTTAWPGVSVANGHIVELNLGNNNIKGVIPASFSNLKYLRKLLLTGHPTYSQYMSDFSTADLSNLSGLESLEYLDLAYCKLSGTLPETWSSLSKLKTLSIYNNALSGPIFNGLGNLKDLEIMDFHNNQFTAIPASISGLTKLKTIDLSYNKISVLIPELEDLTSLTSLKLDYNAVGTIEGLLPTKVSLSLTYQTLALEKLIYRGDDVVLTNLPSICTYNRSKNDFSALNTFYLYLRGAHVGSMQVLADGSLTIPKQYLNTLKSGDAVYLKMSNGTATQSQINFTTTTLDFPMLPEAEYQALVDFYNATRGTTNWSNKWNVTTNTINQGTWYGVSIENGHIVELNLRGNGVNGTIPASFSNLKYLRKLDLYNNNFSTADLSNLSGLERLEYLDLSICNLSGALPAAWSSLSKLKTLNIYNNALSGPIFNELGALKDLEYMNFQNNQFTAIPASISGLTKLKQINLQYNKISVLIKELENLTSLTYLNLAYNAVGIIEGLLPTTVSLNLQYQTVALQELIYRGNDVVIATPASRSISTYNRYKNDFSALNRFYLYVRGSHVAGIQVSADGSLTIPKNYLSSIKQGDAVHLRVETNNGVTYESVIGFTATVDLPMIPNEEYQALVDFYNATRGTSWTNKWTVTTNNLNVASSPWHGVLTENGHIVELNLRGNGLNGTIPASFSNLKYLRKLSLGSNNLSTTDLGNLSGLERLEDLQLSNCYLSGSLPATWSNLLKLKTLVISQNAFSGPIFNELGALKDLESITFSYNQFTAIPASISGLTKLKYINLNYNKISVVIKELENLTSLTNLFLNYNAVTTIEGLLPSTVGLELAYQTLVLEEFIYRGEDVVIPNLPNICKYDRTKNNFSALNTFNLYFRGANMGSIQVSTNGSLTIPKQYISAIKKGDAVYLQMSNGTAYGFRINFTTTTVDLPMVPEAEYQALVDFYNATAGASWTNKWNVATNNLHEGPWYGMTIENGHIVELNLRDNRVNGAIPASFSNLKYLRKLDLFYNNFSTTNLSNLSGLERLEYLDLSYCKLNGSIPETWSGLLQLKTLNIMVNTLSGPIFNGLGDLKNLETINFSNNQFTAVPASISGLTKLKTIDLNVNKISVLIKELENLTSLTSLNLSSNTITDIQGLLPSRVSLSLTSQTIFFENFLYRGNDVVLTNIPNTCKYDRTKNDFSALNNFRLYLRGSDVGVDLKVLADGSLTIPKQYLSSIKKGDGVYLYMNNGTANAFRINFTTVTVDLPMIPEAEYQALVDFYNATAGANWSSKWNVTKNDLNERVWYGVSMESGHIVGLNLPYNNIKGSIPASFSNLKYLRTLELSPPSTNYGSNTNNFSTADLSNLSGLESLEYLGLSYCSLKGSIPATWSSLSKLKTLNINNNAIENIDASFAVLKPTSLNFNYQNINIETANIIYDTMTINLPLYMTMNVTNGVVTFNAKNYFYLYLNGSIVKTAYADNGKVVFDKMNTLAIKATDQLRLYQTNGITNNSSIQYNKISFGKPLENSEYEALKNIYAATNGSQWTNKWTIAENNLDRVSWYGVSIKDGHVVSLILPNNNLTGTLHEEITALPYLEVLNFSGNKIEGSMPQNSNLLPNLQVMDLTSNLLSGTIPASISSLSKLKKFAIGNNKFGGTIPAALSDFAVLEHLDISSNSFDAIEKKLYYDFTKTYIDLRNQRITYDVILKLDGNQLKVTLDDIVKYDLRANNFEAKNSFSLLVNGITHSTTVMNNLGEIIFNNVRINEIPFNAKILVRQTTGSFEGAEFSYAGIEDKSKVPVLESEYLAMVAFFNAMGGNQWINKWNVSSNNFHINKWYGVTTYDGHIVSIDLTSNNVTGQVPAIFTEVPFLNKLVLSSNKVTAIEAVVPAAINFVYDRQTIDMGAIDLVFGSILKNAKINQYEHTTGTFKSQSYDLKIGSFYRNINISTEGLQLTDLMYHWKFPNGQKLELRQISGASRNSILNYTLAYKSGDSNLDNTLNVLDIQTTVNYIMKEYVRYFNYGAADVNNDNTINILDVIGLVNRIQSQSLPNRIAQKTESARQEAGTKAILSIENNALVIDAKDHEITSLEILLDNIQKQQVQDQLAQLGFSVFINETPDNKISLIAFSFSNSLKGKVAIAKLTTESVIINNAMLSNSSADVIPVEIKQATAIFDAVDAKVINYPNPFVTETTIEVPIEEPLDSPVLSIYDFATGKKVQEQVLERITPIYNKIKFNRGNLPSGIYLYIISDKNKSIKSKMYIK